MNLFIILIFSKRLSNKISYNLTIFLFMFTFLFNSILTNFSKKIKILDEPLFNKFSYLLNDASLSILVLIIIFVVTTVFKKNNFRNNVWIVLYLIIINQTHFSKNFFDFFYFSKKLNSSLINGMLLIHPILLYMSLSIFMWIAFEIFFFKKFSLMYKKSFFVKFKGFLYSSIALFLGCYWAQQEANWGGWWNWDPVEFLALLLFFWSLLLLHLGNKINININFKMLLFLLLSVFYVTSRYDILNSIHSFAAANKSSKYSELKTLPVTFVFIYSIFFLKQSIKYYKHNSYNFTNILFLLLMLLIAIQIWISFFSVNSYNYLSKSVFIFIFITYTFLFLKLFNKKYFLLIGIFLYKKKFIVFENFFKFKLFFHFLFLLVVLLLITYSSKDFFKTVHLVAMKPQKLFFLNSDWIYIQKKVNNCFFYFNNYIKSNFNLNMVFTGDSKFFYQNIKTNFVFNINVIDTNIILLFFQKHLFLITCVYVYLIIKSFTKIYTMFKKAV